MGPKQIFMEDLCGLEGIKHVASLFCGNKGERKSFIVFYEVGRRRQSEGRKSENQIRPRFLNVPGKR